MEGPKGPPVGRATSKSKAQLQDDSIMGTNNSSIVSKRSVERLYFPNEAHFFRYFVKKPQRRSPLINRGYWLRMKAIDQVVRHFLERDSPKQKVVVNLGCGYDPLPWQCLERYPAASNGTKFIDIDYRDLMLKKRAVVQSTSELNSMLTGVKVSETEVLFKSDQYIQLGCDLRDLQALGRVLASVIDTDTCTVLFTAEVSITYMNVEASDALIQWASKLPDARFCVLEQLIPDGEDHPYSRTMMAHFDKLRTVLGAVRKYPTEQAQHCRFTGLGWPKIRVRNLWQLWNSPTFATAEDRIALDQVEPFDEWEEFALFGYHYFLLVAETANFASSADDFENSSESEGIHIFLNNSTELTNPAHSIPQPELVFSEYPKAHGYKRFAAALSVKGQDRSHDSIGVFAGMGLNTRTDSMDVYDLDEVYFQAVEPQGSSVTPSSRMCHTIIEIGDISLLVGGRTSPDNVSRECWIYHKWLGIWERVDDLPWPLYRHQATRLDSEHVLVSIGRTDSKTISNDYLIWSRRKGWVRCGCERPPPASYGAVFISSEVVDTGEILSTRKGVLAGGISASSSFLTEVWRWELNGFSSQTPTINFTCVSNFKDKHLVARFGANVVCHQGQFYILGGVLKDRIMTSAEELCILRVDPTSISVEPVPLTFVPRPLLIGSAIVSVGQSLIVTGGSAVCFSFGTFWNKGNYTINLPASDTESPQEAKPSEVWRLIRTAAAEKPCKPTAVNLSTEPVTLNNVPRVQVRSALDFSRILESSAPVIIEKAGIGPCTSKWTTDYLKEKVGFEREVTVHEASTEHMNFKSKNFAYNTKRFGNFLDQIQQGQMLYLRSLSAEKPSEQPADIKQDFPSIAEDFLLPPELAVVSENAHSSPLRISGPVNMWLHYDVMANVYCQIKGSKRLLLFPPTDVKHLGFEPGSSSSQINVFEELDSPSLTGTHPYEALLEPGDILFLPSLWLHAATPTSGVSIAVNVFFRNLSAGYAAGKDVYGNRDLQAYEKGRQDIAKIVKSFDSLPKDVRGFYLQRLVDELKDGV